MLPDDLVARYHALVARARGASAHDPTAAALATADARGRPSVRVVLVKGADARGFLFFTNRRSRKGEELAANPRAALCHHWPALGEQVRIEGRVELLPDAESDAYFATRPRASQLGAWASQQSEALASREALEESLREAEARFAGRDVPRPAHWGGYLLVPDAIELWREGAARLHHRERWEREGEGWRARLLQP